MKTISKLFAVTLIAISSAAFSSGIPIIDPMKVLEEMCEKDAKKCLEHHAKLLRSFEISRKTKDDLESFKGLVDIYNLAFKESASQNLIENIEARLLGYIVMLNTNGKVALDKKEYQEFKDVISKGHVAELVAKADIKGM